MRPRRATSSPLMWLAFAALASSVITGGCGGSISASSSSKDDGGGPADSSASSTSSRGGPLGGDATVATSKWDPLPAADLGPGASIATASFTVQPGTEEDLCQVFANPFGGKDTDILQVSAAVGGGSDRAMLFVIDARTANIEPPVGTIGHCAGHGIEIHPVLMLSQQSQQTTRYPTASDGTPMGYRLSGSSLLMMYTHYLNLGSTAFDSSAAVTLTPAKAGVVTTHVGNMLLEQTNISVPANTPKTSPYDASETMNGDSTLPASYAIFSSQAYLATNALSLTASAAGQVFYRQSASAQPGVFFHVAGAPEPSMSTGQASPVELSNASLLTWACAEYNLSATTITFGDSSKSNAWCLYVAQYYPADPSNADRVVFW